MCNESGWKNVPTYKADFELGQRARIQGNKAKCPFSHETARFRRMAWFAGLNFEKGKEEGFEHSPRNWSAVRSFAEERASGFAAGLSQEKRSIPLPTRAPCSVSVYA